MKTSSKIWLDKVVVGLITRLINYLVIVLGKLLNIDHSLDTSFKVIAVCKYKGMGSILQSVPLLKTLRRKYPDSKILYISSSENIQILRQIREIDEIMTIDDHSLARLLLSFIPFVRKLWAKKIEVYIDLEVYSNFSTLITIVSLSKNRMGFYLNSMHYRLGNYTHMMYYNTRSSISDTYLQFARLLHCTPVVTELAGLDSNTREINVSETYVLDVFHEKYIVINPNASDLRIERRWKALNFVQLIGRIHENYPSWKIFLIGSPSEAPYAEDILHATGIKENLFSLAGKTDIPALIAIIKHAHLFITNDSGPMHIAFSTQTTTIALFGPCSPSQYRYNRNCYVIYENLYCSPCVHEFVSPPCKGNNYCMKAISVGAVLEKVMRVLDNQDDDITRQEKEMLFKIGDFTVGTLNRKKKI